MFSPQKSEIYLTACVLKEEEEEEEEEQSKQKAKKMFILIVEYKTFANFRIRSNLLRVSAIILRFFQRLRSVFAIVGRK